MVGIENTNGEGQEGPLLTSVAEVLSWVNSQTQRDLWFRGQPRNWKPEPSLLRRDVVRALRQFEADRWRQAMGEQYKLGNYEESDPRLLVAAERRLVHEFIREVRPFLDVPKSTIETYFLAQHYRLPTRLLDWTTRPLTALFFSLIDEKEEHSSADGMLYALDPFHLITVCFDEQSGDDAVKVLTKTGPLTPGDNIVERLIGQSFSGETWTFDGEEERSLLAEVDTPIPIAPNLAEGRMFAQGSCFTLHPYDCPPFRETVVRSARISAQNKPEIRNELRRLGVTYATLFPEPESAVRDIRERWSL